MFKGSTLVMSLVVSEVNTGLGYDGTMFVTSTRSFSGIDEGWMGC
mgnify:CR=1 FL=1